jgi:hypothetical protein
MLGGERITVPNWRSCRAPARQGGSASRSAIFGMDTMRISGYTGDKQERFQYKFSQRVKGRIAGIEESGGENDKDERQDWLLSKLNTKDLRLLGNSEQRKRNSRVMVYGMVPDDGSEIRMKELKKKAEEINMSSTTLSFHLKELIRSSRVARRVDDTKFPPRTYYRKLPLLTKSKNNNGRK